MNQRLLNILARGRRICTGRLLRSKIEKFKNNKMSLKRRSSTISSVVSTEFQFHQKNKRTRTSLDTTLRTDWLNGKRIKSSHCLKSMTQRKLESQKRLLMKFWGAWWKMSVSLARFQTCFRMNRKASLNLGVKRHHGKHLEMEWTHGYGEWLTVKN